MGQSASSSSASNSSKDAYHNKIPIVHHERYAIAFWGLEKCHPFDAAKASKIYQHLLDSQLVEPQQFYTPEMPSDDELTLVHSAEYLESLQSAVSVARIVEIAPVAILPNFSIKSHVIEPFKLATNGSILAAQLAMHYGYGINLSGGFHHASANEGGGFCMFSDISLAIVHLNKKFPQIKKFMIVDLDAHQGNGHETDAINGIYQKAGIQVFIYDAYNNAIYPRDRDAKQAIGHEMHLKQGTTDEEYLSSVKSDLPILMDSFQPQFVIFNAGTDILAGDPLGCLNISPEGVIHRDEIVFQEAFKRHIPIVHLLSGGYQKSNGAIIAESFLNLNRKFDLFRKSVAGVKPWEPFPTSDVSSSSSSSSSDSSSSLS